MTVSAVKIFNPYDNDNKQIWACGFSVTTLGSDCVDHFGSESERRGIWDESTHLVASEKQANLPGERNLHLVELSGSSANGFLAVSLSPVQLLQCQLIILTIH